jgi:hypothetical protein
MSLEEDSLGQLGTQEDSRDACIQRKDHMTEVSYFQGKERGLRGSQSCGHLDFNI